MKAENTVMSNRELLRFELKYSRSDIFYWGAAFDAALKAQAEITWDKAFEEGFFKAGEGVWDKIMDTKRSGYDEGRLRGAREVVEFIDQRLYGTLSEGYRLVQMTNEEWQSKLKEWGVAS